MSIYGEKCLKKHFVIGSFDFILGTTRKMSAEAIDYCPNYWKEINSETTNEINENKNNKERTASELAKILDYNENITNYQREIVDFILPKLLEKGETDINGYNSYEEYAKILKDFCEENYILDDYYGEEEGEENIKGFYSIVMEFIQMGFTQGSSQSKPKMKITAI